MCKYGDIYIADKNTTCNLQREKQTVLVVSNDKVNKGSPFITVLPIAYAEKQNKLLSCIFIGSYGMSEKNIAVVGQMTTLNKDQLLVKVGSIRGTVYAEQVKQEIKSYLGLWYMEQPT